MAAASGHNEDNEDCDWNSSRIKGFSFGDDDETPFEELGNAPFINCVMHTPCMVYTFEYCASPLSHCVCVHYLIIE